MKKFNVLTSFFLLFWIQICFAGEIPSGYEFQFFDKKTAPHRNYTDFGSGGCSGDCATKNEVQGITSIGSDYWILSKNKWFYVYKLEEDDDNLFSKSHKVDSFQNEKYDSDNKMKDIDFFDNHLYVPRGNKIDIFEWNNETGKFDKENIVTWHLDTESFSVAIHPYSRHIFYQASMSKVGSTKIIGRKIVNNALSDKKYEIELIDRNGAPINHNTLLPRRRINT